MTARNNNIRKHSWRPIMLFLAILISKNFIAQDNLESITINSELDPSISINDVLKKKENWTNVAYYDYQETNFEFYDQPESIEIRHKIFNHPSVCNDGSDCSYQGRIKVKGNCMRIRYSRHEQVTYCLIFANEEYIILETNFHPTIVKSRTRNRGNGISIKGKSVPEKSKLLRYRDVFKRTIVL